jgi:hypothetical protein
MGVPIGVRMFRKERAGLLPKRLRYVKARDKQAADHQNAGNKQFPIVAHHDGNDAENQCDDGEHGHQQQTEQRDTPDESRGCDPSPLRARIPHIPQSVDQSLPDCRLVQMCASANMSSEFSVEAANPAFSPTARSAERKIGS